MHISPSDRDSGTKSASVREVTVKSFSMANHIRRPGFQLLSLVDPSTIPPLSNAASFSDALCLLPDQYGVYTSLYAALGVLTFLSLAIFNLKSSRHIIVPKITPISLSPRTPSPLPQQSTVTVGWSPYTPPVPVSPRSTLPPSLRMLNNAHAGPKARAASRPGTPLASPHLKPMIYSQVHEDEEEESMFPTQYRNGHLSAEDWQANDAEDRNMGETSYFLPAPGGQRHSERKNKWEWSWTFVFRGRRRRIRLGPISLRGCGSFLSSIGQGAEGSLNRRGVLLSTAIDLYCILWPAIVTWVILAWWMF